jgi:RNA polymerase sigma-70 factor (ECF subfamily)
MDETQAISILKKGNPQGLEQLVRCYQVQAVQTAYLIVGDRTHAEDIAQAAFLKAAEKIHQFDSKRAFAPWFFRIVINDAIKACSRHMGHLSISIAEELDVSPEWLQDPNPGPDELLDTAETRRVVWKALQQLTPKQRAAIVMRYFLGMKDHEISGELHRSLSSIKWSLHAAKKRLRSLLGEAIIPQNPGSPAGNSKHDEGKRP